MHLHQQVAEDVGSRAWCHGRDGAGAGHEYDDSGSFHRSRASPGAGLQACRRWARCRPSRCLSGMRPTACLPGSLRSTTLGPDARKTVDAGRVMPTPLAAEASSCAAQRRNEADHREQPSPAVGHHRPGTTHPPRSAATCGPSAHHCAPAQCLSSREPGAVQRHPGVSRGSLWACPRKRRSARSRSRRSGC